MSSGSRGEPPTHGRVSIKTTHGDIGTLNRRFLVSCNHSLHSLILIFADIELWSKEAPLACRNFIQLAMEGYYNNTIVHKVIKGLLIKMGDPTATGTGTSATSSLVFHTKFYIVSCNISRCRRSICVGKAIL